MKKGFALAIDGPVASGKGTMAEALARNLNGFSVNTGGMYRAVALYCLENKIDTNYEESVVNILTKIKVDLENEKVYLNERDVSERIKESDISAISSKLASYSGVRHDLAERQREIAKKMISEGKIVIVEGRDIGTRVLPDADIKIFLTADSKIRAERRLRQYLEKGISKSIEDVLEETRLRDEIDSTRDTDPLPSNPKELGYWVLDDSSQTEEQTMQLVMEEIRKRGLRND